MPPGVRHSAFVLIGVHLSNSVITRIGDNQHVVAVVTLLILQYGSFNKINCVNMGIGAVDFMLKQKAGLIITF